MLQSSILRLEYLIQTIPDLLLEIDERAFSLQPAPNKWSKKQIIRYLTPYGVSCQSDIDLTDFSSLLRGKTKFRVNLGTQGNGFL